MSGDAELSQKQTLCKSATKAGFEDAAKQIWSHFALPHRMDWENDPNQREYLDAARAVVFAFLSRVNETVTIGELISELEALDG